jgi:hypothetical protein
MMILHKEVKVIASPNIPLGYVGIPYRLVQQLQVEIGDLVPLKVGGMGMFFVTWPYGEEWERACKEFDYPPDGFIFLNDKTIRVGFDIHIDFKPIKVKPDPLIVDYIDLPKVPVSFEDINKLSDHLKATAVSTEDTLAARKMVEAVVGKELGKDFDVEGWVAGRNYCVRAYYKPCIITVGRSATLIGSTVTALLAGIRPELLVLRDEIDELLKRIPDKPEMVVRAILNPPSDIPTNMERKAN